MSELQVVATGYGSIEGPVVDAAGVLYFTDVHNGGVFALGTDESISTVVPKRRGVGGLCLHADGGLIVSGRDVSHAGRPAGEAPRTLLTRDEFPPVQGVSVGGFNDLCADWSGRVLVGPTRRAGESQKATASGAPLMAAGEHAPSELVLITGPSSHAVLYDDVRGVSNGIVVTPDNSVIYHSESGGMAIRVSRFTGPDTVEEVARWSTANEPGSPDGVALDTHGRLWVAMFGGSSILCFSPWGQVLDRIGVPAVHVTNLCFAGTNLDELFITTMDNTIEPDAGASIFRMPAPAKGAPVPYARV